MWSVDYGVFQWGRKTGIVMTVVRLVEPFTTTSGVSNQWFIVNNSEKPERAMQVLNEMYDEFLSYIDKIENKYVKQLCEAFFVEDKDMVKRFKEHGSPIIFFDRSFI